MKTIAISLTAAAVSLSLGARAGWEAATASAPPDTSIPGEAAEAWDLGLPVITLLTPATTGAGDRPLFSWEPVEGAANYSLAIVGSDDRPLWAWYGPETQVILGGWPAPPIPEAPGPLLAVPSTWFVVAFDASSIPIAISELRPVAP